MKDISVIDSNLLVESHINESEIRFYDVNQPPFQVHGVFYDDGKFRRLPEAVAQKVSEGVHALHANTAGGRVRFKTNSHYVAINAKLPSIGKMPHFALTGSAGFDMYVDGRYAGTFVPPYDIADGYESIIYLGSSQLREVTINLPLYSEVSELYVGVAEGSTLLPPEPYRVQKPIVYYGSSITQGGCASRPGNCYQSIVSRRLRADYINLGFSGSARGEAEIARYISGLDMSVFVYDYDHNAPSVEHLAATHEAMFTAISAAKPDLPIVMMSRPKMTLSEAEQQRLEVIKATYNKVVADGDGEVYLLEGTALMAPAGEDGTVDGCHPNDLGFASMAKALGDLLARIIGE